VTASLVLSLEIATCAMVLAVVIGGALATLLTWPRLPARDLIDALISAPLVLPPTVLGYYLLVTLGADSTIGRAWERLTGAPIVFTFAGAVIAATVGSLPLVVRAVRLGLDAVEPSLLAAARTLGASSLRAFVTITLPLAAPGLIAGAMLGFARALGDYGITVMVAGGHVDGTPTGAVYVMDAYFAPHRESDARTMALVMTVVGVTLLYLANLLTRRMTRHLRHRG
jgi:molybdate transport system permease protein